MNFVQAILGIKRSVFRANDAASAALSDAEFRSVHEKAMVAARYKCQFCGFESVAAPEVRPPKRSVLQVHHQDNDHSNNDLTNLTVTCSLDHAVHHLGCDAPTPGGDAGWATQMRVLYAPGIGVSDLNLLQRAIGVALLSKDEQYQAVARQMNDLLVTLSKLVVDAYGSAQAKDFAAALSRLTPQEYEGRCMDGLRVLFHPDIQKVAGGEFVAENKHLPVKVWSEVCVGNG